ncbi:MAG: PCMD domain-containing protein [Butyricimonas faecalis]
MCRISLTFSGPKDIKQITLIANDNQDERVWNIQVVPTIENSNFESWVNIGTSKVNIDPTPGKGLGWATANNTFVQGTTPVPYQKGYAAQIQTGIQNLTGLGIGELITAGTIFTGYFQIKISALSNPPLMTYFGIPFITRPQSISFDAKYVAEQNFNNQKERMKNLLT